MSRDRLPGRGADQFPLRLPPGMRDRLKANAEYLGVSMNTLIINALEEAFPPSPSLEQLAHYSLTLIAAAEMDPKNAAVFRELTEALNQLVSTASLERPGMDSREVQSVLARHGAIDFQAAPEIEPLSLFDAQYELALAKLQASEPNQEAKRAEVATALREAAKVMGLNWAPPADRE